MSADRSDLRPLTDDDAADEKEEAGEKEEEEAEEEEEEEEEAEVLAETPDALTPCLETAMLRVVWRRGATATARIATVCACISLTTTRTRDVDACAVSGVWGAAGASVECLKVM